MSTPPETTAALPSGRVSRRRWISWVWLVPILAACVVVGLAIRTLADRGPLITISFKDAEGLQAGDTRIRNKDVDLGTVESIRLSDDMSEVIVQARMRRSVTDHLNAHTRFWIVRPRVGITGISGLSTLVSGDYIEMYPGDGPPQRDFVGLSEPPALTPDTPGRSFTLHSDSLASLTAGSSISYRGIAVGEIQGYTLDGTGTRLNIYAFVRAPYDKLVHPETRFWNSGGLDVSIAAEGLQLRASSWQELLSGGVAFDTPHADLGTAPSPAGAIFTLYNNEGAAQRAPRDRTLLYSASFTGAEGGAVRVGTEVQLQGTPVGEVTEAHLEYDDRRQFLATRVTLEIDPSRIEIVHAQHDMNADRLSAVATVISHLVANGLRAHLTTANFLTSAKVVSLDLDKDAAPARIVTVDGTARFPSAPSADISQVLATLQSTLHHLDAATAGPDLKHSIQELDRTLTHLDQITAGVEPEVQPLIASLRQTSEAAQRTLAAADGIVGNSAASGADLTRLVRELTDAARSIRDLTDYLDRHPEALIRGRRGDAQ